MTPKKKDARLDYELWNRICRLESILWDNYDKEFIDLIMAEDDNNLLENPFDKAEDIFPF